MDRTFRDVVRRSLSLAQLRSLPKPASASEIRKTFIDYYCEDHSHLFIRSSPVFSLKDPTLAFTNAGMNQFKDVFLGLVEPASSRVANSQKCIRIGGTHNDLEDVGRDGSHHTFFEMLGNWSFGDYFKAEACRMSWDLLTQVYNIPPERLYVTYFGGDEALGLGPDVEVRDIWGQIGVRESHILAFGTKDNFWSGSVTGPCGACTEIHYDRIPGRTDAGGLVNSGNPEVTELWNLVFTEFDRKDSGELVPLKKHFVDTGMGLERLVAVLQGKVSNYDTDLFLPLFETIKKHTGHSGYTGEYGGNAVDCGYRLLADHSRMITVAFSDGMLPYHHNKVRGILRKSLTVAEKIFSAKHDLLKELSSHVAEILSDAYPEIGRNLPKIHYIIEEEAETVKRKNQSTVAQWAKLKKSYPTLADINIAEYPQILDGLEYLKTNVLNEKKGILTEKDVFILFDTYGVPIHMTELIALRLELGFDMAAFLHYQSSIKVEDRLNLHKKYKNIRSEASYLDVLPKLEEKKIQPTLSYFKHDYRPDAKGNYIFKDQETTIEAILRGSELVEEICAEEGEGEKEIGLILDRTQLFSEEGGQASDWGTLTIEKEVTFDIRKVTKIKDFVIHFGTFRKFPSGTKVSVQDIGVLELDGKRRIDIMRNHTALHLVNAFLQDELHTTAEKFSAVTPEKLLLEFMVYKMNLHLTEDIMKLEKFLKDFITHGVSVKRRILNHPQFQAMDDVVFIPGETIVSHEIPVIEINSGFKLSRKYCTGTHLLNTSHLKDFVVTKFTKGSNRVQRIEAVTGEKCSLIRKCDAEVQEKWSTLKGEVEGERRHFSEYQDLEKKMKELFAEVSDSEELSYLTKLKIASEITRVRKNLALSKQSFISDFLKKKILKASEESSDSFVVLCLDIPWYFSPDHLEVALETCNKPVFMIFKYRELVAIQCFVPQNFVSEEFSANNWLLNSAISLCGIGECMAHQTPKFFYYVKDRKATQEDLEVIVKTAVEFARGNL